MKTQIIRTNAVKNLVFVCFWLAMTQTSLAQEALSPRNKKGDFIDYSTLFECISDDSCHPDGLQRIFDHFKSSMDLFNSLGQGKVLTMHPYSRTRSGTLEYKCRLSNKGLATFHYSLRGHPKGDFVAKLKITDEKGQSHTILDRIISGQDGWYQGSFDLTDFLGQTILIRFEAAANGWSFEYAGIDYFYVLQRQKRQRFCAF